MAELISFYTERLVMRPCQREDVDALHSVWTDPGVRRYLWDDTVIDRDTAEEVVDAGIAGFETHRLGMWTVRPVDSIDVIGFCGFRRLPDEGPFEILYGILPTHWGRGLACEASRPALDYALKGVGLEQVVAATDPPNTASVRVMEKLGMSFWKREMFEGQETIFYRVSRHPGP